MRPNNSYCVFGKLNNMAHFLPEIKVVDPDSTFHDQVINIRLEKGKIVDMGADVKKKTNDEVISAENAHISPSWVDIGTQSGEPGFEHRETLASLARAAHAGGYGHLVIRPNTAPPLDQAAAIRHIYQYRAPERVGFHPMALASVDAKGEDLTEWLDLAEAGAAAFTDGPHALRSNAFMLKALKYSQRTGKPLIHSPHDTEFIPGAMVHESRQSVEMGLRGWPAAAETLLLDRDLNLLEYVPAHLIWHNLSSASAIRKLEHARDRFKDKIQAGVGYLNLCYNENEVAHFNTLFKVSPPLRAEEDRMALWKAAEEGWIQYVSSDHFPLEEDRKKTSFPQADFGAEGLESVMSAFFSCCPLEDSQSLWVRLAAQGPRSVLNWEPVSIQIGQLADFTIYNPDPAYVFQLDQIKSRSKNNPNLGRQLKGKVYGRLHKECWMAISEK